MIQDKKGLHMKMQHAGQTLPELFVAAAQKGAIKVYSDTGYDNLHCMPHSQVMDETTIEPDTSMVDDLATGKQHLVFTPVHFDYENITAFRLREHWSYDQQTKTMRVSIDAIGPLKNVYGENNDYRGTKLLFWVKWKDALPLIQQYHTYDTINSIDRLLFDSYFRDSSVTADSSFCATHNNAGNIRTRTALQMVKIPYFHDDYYGFRNLNLWQEPPSLSQLIFTSALTGSLKTYTSACAQQPLPLTTIQYITRPIIDTYLLDDPITGAVVTKVLSHEFDYGNIYKFLVKMQWSFDTHTGTTTITHGNIGLVSACYDATNYKTKDSIVFWVRPADIKTELEQFNAHSPERNFDLLLWNLPFAEHRRQRERDNLFIEQK